MPASTPDTNPDTPRRWWMLVVVMLVALGVRGGALWILRDNLNADPDAYRQLAEALRKTGIYTRDLAEDEVPPSTATLRPSAYRPPLYPLLLAAMATNDDVPRSRVFALHWLLGLATVAVLYRLAELYQLGNAAVVAAVLVACDPILLNQSALVMTETLATFLAVICLWLLARCSPSMSWWRLALAGAGLGLACLCRPTFLPWLGCAALILIGSSRSYYVGLRHAGLLVLSGLLVLAPWGIRNQLVLGQPIITTTHGGYTLWLANNDPFYDYLLSDTGTAWEVAPTDHAAIKLPARSKSDIYLSREILRSQAENAAAWDTIRRRPAMFAYASLARVGYLWSPLPQKTVRSESTYRVLARYLVGLWYVGLYCLALVGAWRLRRQLLHSPWLWGITLCLAVTAIHAVYWSNLRMRAPLMPVVALLAAAGCSAAISRPAPTLRR